MTTLDARDNSRLMQAHFKPLADGYLFETAHPWIFGPTRRYFVTEEQKTALLGTFQRPPTALRIALISIILMVMACGFALLWWKISLHEPLTALDGIGIGAAVLMTLYVVTLVRVRRFLRRVAPIVADAVPTTEKRSVREQIAASTAAIPTKIVVFCLVLWSLATVVDAISVANDAARGSVSSLTAFNLVLALGLALYHAWILRNRRHQVKA